MTTQTQPKRQPAEKSLREDLKKRKAKLERKRFNFAFDDDLKTWEAEKDGTRFGPSESLTELLDQLEGLAKTEKTFAPTDAPKFFTGDEKTVSDSAVYGEMIAVERCVPSPLKSQEQRRRHYTEDALASMAESIRKPHGVIEPIIVRPVYLPNTKTLSHYEIVAGERRWRGSILAEKKYIPARVLTLSDEEAADIYITENIQRTDLTPLEEAYTFQDIMTVFKYDEAEIAARVGKDVAHVKSRLRLLKLPSMVTQALDADEITLRHAEEIAKYEPWQHLEIFAFCFEKKYQWSNEDEKTLRPIAQMRKAIQKDYLKLLKHAPFPTDSDELGTVSCKNCLKRTGPQASLFNEDFETKDACLDPKCWENKKVAFVNLTRTKVAIETLELPKDKAVEKIAEIPLLQDGYISKEEMPKEDLIPKDNYRTLEEKNLCQSAKKGVYYNGNNLGKEQWFCDSPVCPTHGRSFQTKSPEKIKKDESEARLKRKEELFDVRVRSRVRIRVFKHAAEKFDGLKNTETLILRSLVQRMWELQTSYNSEVSEALAYIVCDYFNLKIENKKYILSKVSNEIKNNIESLTDEFKRRTIFLLLRGSMDKMFFFDERGFMSTSYVPQKEVKAMAAEFGINYRLFDAQERLALAPPKHEDIFRAYLLEIEAGNDARIPRIWSTKWKLED